MPNIWSTIIPFDCLKIIVQTHADRVPYLVEFQSARFLSTTTTITNKLQVRLNVREKMEQTDGRTLARRVVA